jgi:hypothetical protein
MSKKPFSRFFWCGCIGFAVAGCSSAEEPSARAGESVGETEEVAQTEQALPAMDRCATVRCPGGTRCVDDGTTVRCVPFLSRQCGQETCIGSQRCCPGPRPYCAAPFEVCFPRP